jgi:hypothetical protein
MPDKTKPANAGFVDLRYFLGHFNFNAKVRLGGDKFATQTVHKVRQGANVETNDASPMQ